MHRLLNREMQRYYPEHFSAFCSRSSPFGPVIVFWSFIDGQPKIVRILLSKQGQSAHERRSEFFPGAVAASNSKIDDIADTVVTFLHGEKVKFSLEHVHLRRCSRFQQKVLRAEHRVPRGEVTTYKRIARYLGDAGKARAVGNALANNPFPIIVPCHRAIRSDGLPGGYQGGLKMKEQLLRMEGIDFDRSGRVIIRDFFY